LQGYGTVRGLVFGAWGEASPDIEKLLTWLAGLGASRHWRTMGCLEEAKARGILAWSLRRRWGLTAVRENARLKLDRLRHVGSGAAIASQRRAAAAGAWSARTAARAVAASAGHWRSR